MKSKFDRNMLMPGNKKAELSDSLPQDRDNLAIKAFCVVLCLNPAYNEPAIVSAKPQSGPVQLMDFQNTVRSPGLAKFVEILLIIGKT